MQKFGVLIQVSKWIDLEIKKEFEFEIQPHITYNTNQTSRDFIQSSTVHSETLFWDLEGAATLTAIANSRTHLTMAKWSLDGGNGENPRFRKLLLP
jgi:hypothetical protein